jgi:Ca2+-binding RTX toxin-like protein
MIRFTAKLGNDNLQGQDGNDTLEGGEGNDALYGQAGDDVIDGGAGADALYGDVGNDTYLFGRGDGIDMIAESSGNHGNDTLRFKEGVTVDDLIIKQLGTTDTYAYGSNFVIGLKEDGKIFDQLSDKITIQNGAYYYENGNGGYDFTTSTGYDYRIENFEFADGTKWTLADLVAHTNSDDNDAIHGFRTADTLTGGKGNDTLRGYMGDDTYIFNRGDGQDVIYDYGRNGSNYSYVNAGNDTLKLGEGIALDDLIMQKSGNDVIVAIKEDGVEFTNLADKVTLKDWYNVNNRIERFVLSDGTVIDTAFLFDPTPNDDNLNFGAEDNIIHALAGNDVIYAGAGNDTVYGEAGNDNLQGQDGNDTLEGGEGNDALYGQAGDDVIDGGAGADALYGDVGNDTYLFGRGDGIDMIAESSGNHGNDTLRFKEGVTVDDLIIKQLGTTDTYAYGSNFVIGLKEDGKIFDQLSDKITIQNGAYYYENGNGGYDFTTSTGYDYRIENFEFADGTKWTLADLVAHTNSDDNDAIHGFRTADTLTGGKGNDTLRGYMGDDTYIFNRGDGQDVIYDYGRNGSNYSYVNAGNDTLKLGEGIALDDLIMQKSGNDVIVAIKEDGVEFTNLADKVTLKDWYNVNNRIERFVLSDGTVIDTAFLFDPTPNDDNLNFGAEDNIIHALAGNDVIVAGAGNDTDLRRSG